MDEKQDKKTEKKRLTTHNFETTIDKQIREAMERGDFENLKNKGKPLNLGRDPNVPEDWELAFNMLKNAGFAPDWIETKKEVEAARDKLFVPLQRFLASNAGDAAWRKRRANELADTFRAQAAGLNRLIDTYNLKAPTPQVHMRRVRVEEELKKFLDAAK